MSMLSHYATSAYVILGIITRLYSHMVIFYKYDFWTDDESGESTQQEDEESETAETDDLDAEEVILTDEQLERRP